MLPNTWTKRHDIQVVAFVFFALQIVLLVLWSLPSTPKTKVSIPAAVFGVVGAGFMIVLSYIQHIRSTKPSLYLNGYLLLTLILDLAQARSLWIRQNVTTIAAVYTTALVTKVVLLTLEEIPKPISQNEKGVLNETNVGIMNRGFFFWLNKLFLAGSRTIPHICDIESTDHGLSSETLLARLEAKWNKGMNRHKCGSKSHDG